MSLKTYLLTLLSFAAVADGVPPVPAREVACYMSTPGGVVMVRDVWSRRLSLPGGRVAAGANPTAALSGAVHAKTGMEVVVGSQLAASADGRALYACSPQRPLRQQGRQLDMPAAARKVSEALLEADPVNLPVRKWRDRQAAGGWAALCAQAAAQHPPSPTLAADGAPSAAPLFYRELAVNAWLQVKLSTWADAILRLGSQLGHVHTLFAVGLLLWVLRGRAFACEFFFAVMLASLVNCFVKDLCCLPRPCYLLPSLARDEASNFGFPSGHTMLCATMVGTLARRSGRYARQAWGAAALAVIFCGTARIYLGVHFLHDVLGATCLASLLLLAHARLCRRFADGFVDLHTWARLGLGATLSAWGVCLAPASLLFAAAYSGLWLSLRLGAQDARAPQPPARWGARFALGAVALGVGAFIYLCLDHLASALQPQDGNAWGCALTLGLRFCAYGALLPWLSLALQRRATPALNLP